MIFIAIANFLLNICFTILSASYVEPIRTFFYPIAWYTFLVSISAVNYLISNKEFTIFNYKNFAKTAFISVFVWLIFELFNLRLKNWAYCDVPPNISGLHIFGFLCFSTVLPGIFNIANFFEKLFRVQSKTTTVNPTVLNKFFLLGIISVILLLTLPKIFFPLLWLCFIFILEPLNFYLFKKTIVLEEIHKIPSLLLSGFVCGGLWELWNFFSGAHWVYTLPSEFLMKLKIFQMPLLGYFGFPFFAIEAYQIYKFIENIIRRLKFKLLLAAFYVSFCVLLFNLITDYTVVSFR
ncbi:MAG: hypothetical protein QME68_01020 [Elusimicrobiota bacterium]|nr:hypothetical protein [Elusimicrobiota bacterium]